MRKTLLLLLLLAAIAAAGTWWYLGRDRIDPDAPLAFVPADTPFVFASTNPPPPAAIAQWEAQMAAMGEVYANQFADLRALLADKPDSDPRLLAVLDAIEGEFAGKTPMQAYTDLGLSTQAQMAVYGLGLLPVARIELADAAKMHAFLGRLADAAGDLASAADIDGAATWTYAPPEIPLAGLIAIVGDHLVISLLPRTADRAVQRQILGLDRPPRSLADSRGLHALNREFGYIDFVSGYIDSARLLDAATGEPDAIQAAFLAAIGLTKPSLDATCRGEFAALAAAWPRMSLGYTALDARHAAARGVIETRTDIAQALMKLRAPMPGLPAVDGDTLVHFGLSLKLAALPEVVHGFAKQAGDAPWQCDALKPLNDGFAQARQAATNPGLFMAAPVFRGFHIALTKLTLGEGGLPEDIAAVLTLGSDNPAALLGLAQSVAPQIAGAGLVPDGEVRALPPLPNQPIDAPLHAAMSEHTLALSIGEGEQTRLARALQSNAAEQPLLVIGASARFYTLLADLMARQAADLPADADAETRAKLEALNTRMARKADTLRTVYANLFQRMDMRIEFTERGIELHQTVDLP